MKLTDEDLMKEEAFVAGPEFGRDGESPQTGNDDDLTMVASGSTDKQDGVKRIEAVAQTWSETGLIVAYVG